MGRVSSGVAAAPDEWLTSISGPVSLVVKGLSIPNSLQQDLWDLDWVGARAVATALKGTARGVGNMVTMIRAVQVLAVPACRETVVRHDTGRAGLSRECKCFWLTSSLVLHADIGKLAEVTSLLAGPVADVTDEHSETGLEGSNSGLLGRIEECIRHVVDDHTALGSVHTLLGSLWHTLVGSILGLKVQDGSPVVTLHRLSALRFFTLC